MKRRVPHPYTHLRMGGLHAAAGPSEGAAAATELPSSNRPTPRASVIRPHADHPRSRHRSPHPARPRPRHLRDPGATERILASIVADDHWLLRNREAINQRLDESFAAAERGESYSPEEALAILAKRRTTQAAN